MKIFKSGAFLLLTLLFVESCVPDDQDPPPDIITNHTEGATGTFNGDGIANGSDFKDLIVNVEVVDEVTLRISPGTGNTETTAFELEVVKENNVITHVPGDQSGSFELNLSSTPRTLNFLRSEPIQSFEGSAL